MVLIFINELLRRIFSYASICNNCILFEPPRSFTHIQEVLHPHSRPTEHFPPEKSAHWLLRNLHLSPLFFAPTSKLFNDALSKPAIALTVSSWY